MHNEEERQVREQMARFNAATDDVHETIGRLEDRLGTVLREEPSSSGEDSKAPQLVPLANELRTGVDLVVSMGQRLNSIIKRLEL